MIYRYPTEVHDFIKEWAPKLRDSELAEACNRELGTSFTETSVKAFRNNHDYRTGRKHWMKDFWKYQTRYPQGMYEFIRDNSLGVSSAEMAEMVNKKFGTEFTRAKMKNFRNRYHINSGLTGWFPKGNTPANKGKKLEEFIGEERAKEAKKKMSASWFKKGNHAVNEMPLGTVKVNKEGYKLIKVSMTGPMWDRWKLLQRVVWEEHNGPIPEGMIVIFKDSNKLNCNIDNLLLISRREHQRLNREKLRSEDPNLTETGLELVRLRNAIKDRRKK